MDRPASPAVGTGSGFSSRSLKDQVQEALYAAGASVYQQTAGQGPGRAAPGQDPTATAGAGAATGNSTGGGDDVIDADFTETK